MLILLPNFLSQDAAIDSSFVSEMARLLPTIDGFIGESEKGTRALLKHFKLKKPLQETVIKLLNEHTIDSELEELIAPLERGETWAVVSDAGLPSLADPGAKLVRLAHEKKIPVRTVVGPSSIVMALQLSGCGTQCFNFHGYVPADGIERKAALSELSKKQKATHILIEAPYRNKRLLADLIEILPSHYRLAVVSGLMSKEELILSLPIFQWKRTPLPEIDRIPTVFVFSV